MSEPRIEESAWKNLQFERVGDVLRVVIAHPTNPMNVVDGDMHDELARLFRLLKRERSARAILLTGRGKAFSAGGDFNWFPTLQDPEKLEETRRDGKQLVTGSNAEGIPFVLARPEAPASVDIRALGERMKSLGAGAGVAASPVPTFSAAFSKLLRRRRGQQGSIRPGWRARAQ